MKRRKEEEEEEWEWVEEEEEAGDEEERLLKSFQIRSDVVVGTQNGRGRICQKKMAKSLEG